MSIPLILCIATVVILLFSVVYILLEKQKEKYDFDTDIYPLTPEQIEKLSEKQKDDFWYMTVPQFSKLKKEQKDAFKKLYGF